MTKVHCFMFGAIAAALLLLPLAVAAQSSENNDVKLEEVIVTAQKRAQNFNDVGIAVDVFSGQDIQELGC